MKFFRHLLFGLCALSFFSGPALLAFSEDAKSSQTQQKLVNINTATQAELETLPQVGPATAQRIIAFREEHKGFKTVEELLNVKGIGPKTFEKLKPLVTL